MLRNVTVAVVCLTVAAAVSRAADPVAGGPLVAVNITQGTNSLREFSHGGTLPLVGPPWAMTDWAVQNNGNLSERWFFLPKNTRFVGIRATHQPSPWAGDSAAVLFTPQTGPLALSTADRGCDYDPAAAVMRPDYVRLRLPKFNATVELTSSERCGVLRMTFDPAEKIGRLVIDPAGQSALSAQGDKIVGYTRHHGQGGVAGDFHCYYVAQLDRPVTRSAGVVDVAPRTGRRGRGGPPHPPGYVEFDVANRPTVEVRIATSYISAEQAWRTLAAETAGGFDGVQRRTAAAWDAKLKCIDVDGTDERRATLYTCLYRAMKYPHKFHEPGPGGKPIHYSPWDGNVHDGVAYVDSGLWDTYRTQFPFLSIVDPKQLGEIVAGWLNAYREGGWLPQWPSPGGFRGMPGSHADAMIADTMVKHVGGFDTATAYAALRRDAFDVPVKDKPFHGREAMGDYLRLGYVPAKASPYWVSTSLDFAYDDWCVAQAAKVTGHDDDYRTLMARSQNYRKSWDPAVKFMRGKNRDGTWAGATFDEFAWGDGYTESGPWQASWGVQHDAAGLAELAGGPVAFAGILDKLFGQKPVFHVGGYGNEIHEMTEFAACDMGQYAGNNQPSFHIPYLYTAVGQPWKTEYWTRRACRQLFNAGPDGFMGDDDNGSNACWYLFSSLGIYPLTPGHPTYVLTSPEFRSATIHLPNGKSFTVSAPDNSAANVYVQSRTLNGKPLTRTWIGHEQIVAGGTLVDRMGETPAERVVTAGELPYSATVEMKR